MGPKDFVAPQARRTGDGRPTGSCHPAAPRWWRARGRGTRRSCASPSASAELISGRCFPALHIGLGVREQKYECLQNIAVRSTFVRYSRSIIDGPYTNEPFVRSSYYVPLLTMPFVRCWKLIWVIERPGKIRRTIIVTDLEHRGRKSLLKQMVQCVCRVFIMHCPHGRGDARQTCYRPRGGGA